MPAHHTARTAPPAAVPRRGGQRAARVREAVTGYAFLAPSVLGVLLFMVVPVGVIVWLAFHKWDLISSPEFVGLSQITDTLGDPEFRSSIGITLGLVVLVVPVQIVLGLALANMLTKGVRGTNVLRALIVIPWISSPLALGVVWSWLLAPTGGVLSTIAGHRLEILVSDTWALPAVAFVVIWNQVGYTSLFFIAGLLSIPSELIEAAWVDGASPSQIFWRIKVPLLRPTFFFVSVTSVIAAFNVFDQVYALTGGGPDGKTSVLAYQIYSTAFVDWNIGKASVMALVMFLILLAITLAQNLYFRRRTTYELV
ncbi:carbohydrate ABC transporter permease [Actinomyces radicidentis]|uniref:carbohydrate ABC transporter permease n=1 Tax=Actinomyces radicidentis TaxID=111015 RepID=UPI001F208874|nr:sugar ABC transporter permease [Actinomyces radicidentis]